MVSVALLVRLIVAGFAVRGLPDPTRDFEQFGWEIGWTARSLATGHGYGSPFFPFTGPTALVPPGYTFLLAGIFRLFGVYSMSSGVAILSLNCLFSALTCVPIYLLAREAADTRIARFAGWGWVVYPFSIFYASQVWEFALTALLFTLCLALLARLHRRPHAAEWAAFALLYGLTALVNPAVLGVLPVLLALVIWRLHRARSPWLGKALLTTAVVVAVLTPWILYASCAMHTFVPVRDGYWLEFYAGNNGDTFKSNAASAHPASNPVEMRRYQEMGEAAYLALQRSQSIAAVQHHPGPFLLATARRVLRYWTGFWSFTPRYLQAEPLDVPNVFFCSAVTFLMLRGLRRLWMFHRSAARVFLLLLAVFPSPYYLSHTSMDYRQPIEPAIVILAVIGLGRTRDPAGNSSERMGFPALRRTD